LHRHPESGEAVRERRMREQVWSPEEIRKFLEVARDDRYAAAWQLLAMTGLRRGELLGLPWSAENSTTALSGSSRRSFCWAGCRPSGR
jgi:integrase